MIKGLGVTGSGFRIGGLGVWVQVETLGVHAWKVL